MMKLHIEPRVKPEHNNCRRTQISGKEPLKQNYQSTEQIKKEDLYEVTFFFFA